MSDFESKLSILFDKLDAKRTAAEDSARDSLREIDAFIAGFESKRSRVLAPVFQELGKALKSRGHDFFIKESHYERHQDAHVSPASISLEIYLKDEAYEGHSNPHLEYITQAHSKSIVVHVSTMGPDGGSAHPDRRLLTLGDITPDSVRERFLELFESFVNS